MHGSHIFLATRNPSTNSDTPRCASICSSIHLDLLAIPSPIHINSPFSLTQTHYVPTLRQTCDSSQLPTDAMRHPPTLVFQERETLRGTSLLVPFCPPLTWKTLEEQVSEWAKTAEGPVRPKRKALTPPRAHLIPITQALPMSSSPSANQIDHALSEVQGSEHIDAYTSLSPHSPNNALPGFIESKPMPEPKEQQENSAEPAPITQINVNDPSNPFLPETIPSNEALLPIQTTLPRAKGNQVPARRSQRIQAKQRPSYAPPKASSKPKTATVNIPFLPNSQQTPMEAENTMQILQAIGLHITPQMEVLIQEAIKLDQSVEMTQPARPQTPLHDLIPLRVMLGDDMVL